MIFEMLWVLNNDFFCFSVKLIDFCVFHIQRRVVVKKGDLLFRIVLVLRVLLTLCCLFLSLYLAFFFLFFSVWDIFIRLIGSEAGVVDLGGADGSGAVDDSEGA